MLNKKFWLGMLVIMLAFGMVIVGCEDEPTEEVGSGFLGSTLNLSGQVWTEWEDDNGNIIYEQFKGNIPGLSSGFWEYDDDNYDYYFVNNGGSGSVTNGLLSFSIGTPSNLEDINEIFPDSMSDDYNNFNISPSNAKIAALGTLRGDNGNLYKDYYEYNNGSETEEDVVYLYVDRDVTITGGGKTKIKTCDCEEDYGFCECLEYWGYCNCAYTFITKNLNISLKKGWNVVTNKYEWNESNNTETETISLGDSSRARWVVWGYEPPATIPPANPIQLTADTWANGNFTNSVREQYFSFTATANQHYIHFNPGAVDDVKVAVYNSSGTKMGDTENLYWNRMMFEWTLTSGQTYYVRVWPYYNNDNGSYQIAFNTSYESPPVGLSLIAQSIIMTDSKVANRPTKLNRFK